MNQEILEIGLSVSLGVVFLMSALPKLRRPKNFMLIVLEYRILPTGLGRIFANALPPLEFLVSLLLLTGLAVRASAVVVLLLTASFMAGIGINLARGRRIACGCFGVKHERVVGWQTLIGDAALCIASASLVRVTPTWTDIPPWSLIAPIVRETANGSLVEVAGVVVLLLVTLAARRVAGRNVLKIRLFPGATTGHSAICERAHSPPGPNIYFRQPRQHSGDERRGILVASEDDSADVTYRGEQRR